MTVYEFLKKLSDQYGMDALVKSGIVQYNTVNHISIYEELLLASKNNQEQLINNICAKYSIQRRHIFRIKKKMSQGIAL